MQGCAIDAGKAGIRLVEEQCEVGPGQNDGVGSLTLDERVGESCQALMLFL